MPRGNAPSKIDANQPEIVAALREAGYYVLDMHALGHGVPDVLVTSKADASRVLLLEVKTAAGRLTTDERDFFAAYPGRVCVVRSAEQAIETMQEFEEEAEE